MYKTLETIRDIRMKVRKLDEQIVRMSVAYKGPSLDGMPKGGGGSALEARSNAKMDIEAKRDEMEREAKALEAEARKEINNLPADLYAFCVHYYLTACSAEETCRIIDREKSALSRYKRRLREMLCECHPNAMRMPPKCNLNATQMPA
ncbi:MAG: hypothetical protein IJ418_08950 [Clostridia bacterium]|nr:hypothetical protein [Clostridia bacterium]